MTIDSENYKQQVIAVFDTVAEGYDNVAMRFFAFTADKLVDVLKPSVGDKVLDIATGTGAVATSCAQAVLPNGRVTAIDLSEAMLAQAMEKSRLLALENIDFFIMDAEQLQFEHDYFDHAICSFGIFFLPEMTSALKEWVRVVKPGGKLIFSSFTENAFQPMMKTFFSDLEEFGVQFDEPSLKIQKLSNKEQCRELMAAASLDERMVEKHQMGYHLHGADDWWEIVRFSGLRGMLNKLDQQLLGQFKAKHLESIQSLFNDNELWMDVEVLISQGKVPPVQ